MGGKLKEIYDKFAGDPYSDLSKEELLSRIVVILKSRPLFEGNRPLGTRLGVWLACLEEQLSRERREKRKHQQEMQPRII